MTVVDNLNASECTCTESESVYADWVNVLYDYMLRCGAAMINVFSGLVCLAALFVILWICWVFSSWPRRRGPGRRIYICSSSTTRHCGDICRFCFHKEAPCAWPGGIFLTLVSSTTQDIFPGCPLGHQSSYPYPTDQARATSSHDGGERQGRGLGSRWGPVALDSD